jgi:hypothetical protein
MVQEAAFTFTITGEAQTECKRERKPNGKQLKVKTKENEKE